MIKVSIENERFWACFRENWVYKFGNSYCRCENHPFVEITMKIAGLSKMYKNVVSNFPDGYLLWNHFPAVLHVPES
jgi:hypothetical protein